jgi:ADP-L-glycero-D-manno-heptose 6-epimerase
MIVLTGAGGFVGSVVLGYLNSQGIDDIVIYDDIKYPKQFKNLHNKRYFKLYSINDSPPTTPCEMIIHVGANSNTLETDWNSIYNTNIKSTRAWNDYALSRDIPIIFTSSAAVLGNGTGPENLYAFSKAASEKELSNAAVLRLYNVYGPNEYHKGRMASTIMHWYNQIVETGELRLFENSERYLRDFIYVEDVAKVIFLLYKNFRAGVFPVGTGNSVSFETVADIMIEKLGGNKTYIEMPGDLQSQYQTKTQAKLVKTQRIVGFNSLELKDIAQGIDQYLGYLDNHSYY